MIKRYVITLFLFSLLIIGLVKCAKPTQADGVPNTSGVPNTLVVVVAPVPAQVVVTQSALVSAIYTHLLKLPPKPAGVCPFYIKAEYQLTFLAANRPALSARVLEGGCNTVVLSTVSPHVRALDSTLLKLLAKVRTGKSVINPLAFGGGYRPVDLQSAYNLPSSPAGAGQTVAIVDAYNDPFAESDLAVYRASFGLPACDTPNGCFRKVNQLGGSHFPRGDVGWSTEIALDLDMVSAVCPLCHILLVEANTASFHDLGTSVNTAARLGASVISNSYGAPEDSSTRSYAQYYAHPGVIIVASSGDSGYEVQSPASYNTVTAVGGTTLTRATNARGWQETAWPGSGSGCSGYVSKPVWQWDSGCARRTVVDVAAVADPATGVAVYDTYGSTGWGVYGGTSVSAPIIAGVYALAGNASYTTNEWMYKHTEALNGIVSGKNGTCNPVYLCSAGPGYNGPTGLGTPNGVGAF